MKKNTMKKHKMLVEFVNKKETEHGSIGIKESVWIIKKIWDIAKKAWFECYMKGYPKDKLDYKPTGKTYEIETLEDIAELSESQFEFFIDDLRNWTNTHRAMNQLNKDIGMDIVGSSGSITWLDTGLNSTKVNIEVSSKL